MALSLTIEGVERFLAAFAPMELAEEWDNVGLLVGDRKRTVKTIMTCLTITPDVADEAVRESVELIMTHHPLPFRPLNRVTTDTTTGSILLRLIAAGIAVYSPHTAFDSAQEGINQRLAEGIGLSKIAPMRPVESLSADIGGGRWGLLEQPLTLRQLADRVKKFVNVPHLQCVGEAERSLSRVAVACGSGGEFLPSARDLGCECLLTGEMRFHDCLEAEAIGMSLILAGHFASERFGVERLADTLTAQFPLLTVFASRAERDPLRWE